MSSGWRERRPGEHVFEAGPIVVVVDNIRADGGLCTVRAFAGERLYADTVVEGIDAANARLREAHDALTEHFAPVLRWELFRVKSHCEHVATFNRYRLEAGEKGCWELFFLSKSGVVIERADHGRAVDGPSARRAAETALRELGVAFRVEEDGAA